MKVNGVKCLIIMDGFGLPIDESRSAIKKENTKDLRYYFDNYPFTKLQASENAVGLPDKQPGTSDVGHLTIGTGRVKYQPLVLINRAIKSGEFAQNKVILDAIENAKKSNRAMHLMGIPTDGGVHGHINHLIELIRLCSEHKLERVYIHYFTDGRDTPPKSAKKYLKKINAAIKKYNCGKIASIIGRVYALDRDKNWDRVQLAYDAMVQGKGIAEVDAEKAIDNAYLRGETDEFIMPIVIHENNKPVGLVKKYDSVISYNYRADRERQLALAFDDSNELNFGTKDLKLHFVCMTEYDESLKNCSIAYPPIRLKNILSEILSERGYNQLKVAETEKFPYITFAFNDGRVEEYPNEDRILINSIKLKSYISKPEMGAYEIAEKTVDALKKNIYDIVIINFANCDMVGHSGDIEATKKAVQVVNDCVKKVTEQVLKQGGEILLTADHGNADIMFYEDGTPCTSHTAALVPFVLISNSRQNIKLKKSGTLADIAPTLLKMIGEKIPNEMTGKPLF